MKRLDSIDALRGFDMLFLMGLNYVILSLFDWNNNYFLARQMNHVPWQGFVQRDLVFPLFLFIAGMTFPFSCATQRERGRSTGMICARIARRCLTLTVLGLLCDGVLSRPWGEIVWGTVLGQIGFAWAVAALLFVFTERKTRIGVMVVLLVGYAVVLRTCVAPDNPGLSPFSMDGNIAGWLDRAVFPNAAAHYYQQGIFSHVSAIATALLGVLTGEFVRSARLSGDWKSFMMFVVGATLAVLGYVADASGFLPIVKKMWTPSFVMVAGGWSIMMFAFFYWLIDVRGYWSRTEPLRAVGMNAITIYLIVRFIPLWQFAKNFTGFAYRHAPKYWGDLLTACVQLTLAWSLMWFFYRRKIFLKV